VAVEPPLPGAPLESSGGFSGAFAGRSLGLGAAASVSDAGVFESIRVNSDPLFSQPLVIISDAANQQAHTHR
jgi:hypothetical protein